MKRTGKSLPRWRVTRIGGARAREICELEAKTAGDAMKRVIREYPIDNESQKRLAAYRVALSPPHGPGRSVGTAV